MTTWNTLSPDAKRSKYSEFACHELNLFLRRKDPEFFKAVVLPFIASKHEKTFVDRWLLEEDLARFQDPAVVVTEDGQQDRAAEAPLRRIPVDVEK